jgi:hypothetical protein
MFISCSPLRREVMENTLKNQYHCCLSFFLRIDTSRNLPLPFTFNCAGGLMSPKKSSCKQAGMHLLFWTNLPTTAVAISMKNSSSCKHDGSLTWQKMMMAHSSFDFSWATRCMNEIYSGIFVLAEVNLTTAEV